MENKRTAVEDKQRRNVARVKALKLKKLGLSQASDTIAGDCLCAWWVCLGLKSGCVREEFGVLSEFLISS